MVVSFWGCGGGDVDVDSHRLTTLEEVTCLFSISVKLWIYLANVVENIIASRIFTYVDK